MGKLHKSNKMGKKHTKKQKTYNDKKIKRLTQKIHDLNFKKKVITSIIKPKKLLRKLPVDLCDEYINMFGNKYPSSSDDLDDVLEIILIQYNRIIKSDIIDQKLLENIKKSTINLCRIVNYFVFDNELIKLLKIVDMLDDNSHNTLHYLKPELDNIYAQLKRSEQKVYLLLINRLKNSNIQSRYITEYTNYLKNSEKNSCEEEQKELTELSVDTINNVLQDLDNLSI